MLATALRRAWLAPPVSYATWPGRLPFYARLGFLRMNTAMTIWRDPARAIATGLLSAAP